MCPTFWLVLYISENNWLCIGCFAQLEDRVFDDGLDLGSGPSTESILSNNVRPVELRPRNSNRQGPRAIRRQTWNREDVSCCRLESKLKKWKYLIVLWFSLVSSLFQLVFNQCVFIMTMATLLVWDNFFFWKTVVRERDKTQPKNQKDLMSGWIDPIPSETYCIIDETVCNLKGY